MSMSAGSTPASGVRHAGIQLDRAQVDRVLEGEPELQQQPALEHT